MWRSSDEKSSSSAKKAKNTHGHSIMNIKWYKMLIIRNNLHNYFTDFFPPLLGHIYHSSLSIFFECCSWKNVWIFCVFQIVSRRRHLPMVDTCEKKMRRRSTDNCGDLCWYVKKYHWNWRKTTKNIYKFYYPPKKNISKKHFTCYPHINSNESCLSGAECCCRCAVWWCSALLFWLSFCCDLLFSVVE